MSVFSRASATLFRPVDIASLVFFRVAFGLVMLWEVYRYFDHGWISRYWIEPAWNFPYDFFEWVRPWPGDGMYVHFYVMGALALCITVGFLYRLSAALFFLAFAYMFLLEQARYLNHFYLVALVSFLMIFVPAHRAWSVDAWLRPRLRSHTIPAWPVVLLAGQMGIVYFFGGIAKLNLDWLRGEPFRAWLARRTDFPLIGPWFTEEWLVYFFAYSGLVLDLLTVPLLLWHKTRSVMFALLVMFHYMNDRLFSIGIVPWLAIAATTLFFPPDWPRTLVAGLRGRPDWRATLAWVGAVVLGVIAMQYRAEVEVVPILIGAIAGALLGWTLGSPATPPATATAAVSRWALALVCVWFALQVAIPLRHLVIPGSVHWTEEGHNFSWHMMLRSKDGDVRFYVVDRSDGSTWIVDPFEYLNDWQYDKMATRPQMTRLFARYLARDLGGGDDSRFEIRALAMSSLNGRERQLLVDPSVDLAREPYRHAHAPWIMPLTTPLSATPRRLPPGIRSVPQSEDADFE